MRYIDLDLVAERLEAEPLIKDATQARDRIATTTADERKKAIEAEQPSWVAFRALFEEIFGRKCWYTESENPGTDDDIDHFRPKGRLAEDPMHGGYWWEALNWRNFRLSCHRANRLRNNPETQETHGKGDHFPLIVEADRCKAPTDDLEKEAPTLLDPTVPGDPPLLSFNMDGTVAVSPKRQGDLTVEARIDASRVYLHLEWPPIKEGRQKLYRRILTRINDGDAAEERWLQKRDFAGRKALHAAARDLIRLTDHREPYSRAAQIYVRVFRQRSWVEQLVLPHIPEAF